MVPNCTQILPLQTLVVTRLPGSKHQDRITVVSSVLRTEVQHDDCGVSSHVGRLVAESKMSARNLRPRSLTPLSSGWMFEWDHTGPLCRQRLTKEAGVYFSGSRSFIKTRLLSSTPRELLWGRFVCLRMARVCLLVLVLAECRV